LTCTWIVIVAGTPLRAETVQFTVSPDVEHVPFVALALTIVSCGLITSRTIMLRGEPLLLKTEIE
jgi:hypothetical protein